MKTSTVKIPESLNATDQWHDRATRILSSRKGPLHTTDRRDFTMSRRFGRERLPAVLPPD